MEVMSVNLKEKELQIEWNFILNTRSFFAFVKISNKNSTLKEAVLHSALKINKRFKEIWTFIFFFLSILKQSFPLKFDFKSSWNHFVKICPVEERTLIYLLSNSKQFTIKKRSGLNFKEDNCISTIVNMALRKWSAIKFIVVFHLYKNMQFKILWH